MLSVPSIFSNILQRFGRQFVNAAGEWNDISPFEVLRPWKGHLKILTGHEAYINNVCKRAVSLPC